MKIEDVSGLTRRASMAEQLAGEIAAIREQIAFASGDKVTYTVGAHRDYGSTRAMELTSFSRETSGLNVRNGNPNTLRAAVLGVLHSELDARLAALEAL